MPSYPQPRDRIPFHKNFYHRLLAPPPRPTKSNPVRLPRNPALAAARHKGDVQLKQAITRLRDTIRHRREKQRLARAERRYRRFFRRRRGHRVGRSPACLRCALGGLRCSATYVRYQDDVRCRRCERNGDEFCVRQREDVTAGEVLDPAWLRQVKRSPAVRDPVSGRKALDEITRGEQRRVVNPFGVGKGGKEVWEAECMVYCLDPVLRDDKRRLLDIAGDMLHYDDAKFVHGTRVSAIHARNFALPMWHENDKPGNKADPECLMRMPVAYFREVKARREERRMEIEMRVEVSRAKEAHKAELSRIEDEKRRLEEAAKLETQRIEEEKAKVRKMYNDMGSEEDIRRRSAERRRIIGEQLRLGKNVVLIKTYLEELTDKYIEEIKLGLRTDLPI